MKKVLILFYYLILVPFAYPQKAPVVKLLKNISSNTYSSPTNFTKFKNKVYFIAYSDGAGRELWKTDGTEVGTVIVKDIYEGSNSSEISEIIVFNDFLYFLATNSAYGRELWKTDGTEEGTVILKDINPSRSSGDTQIGELTIIDSVIYFHADDGIHGNELWKTDGTEFGTMMVKDIALGSADSHPTAFNINKGMVYFSANSTDSENSTLGGREIWKTDGTEIGTKKIKDFGVGNGRVQEMIAFRACLKTSSRVY